MSFVFSFILDRLEFVGTVLHSLNKITVGLQSARLVTLSVYTVGLKRLFASLSTLREACQRINGFPPILLSVLVSL